MEKFFKITGYLVLFLLIIYLLASMFVPEMVDKEHNKIRQTPPYKVSDKSRALYNSLDFIADLHCDALLWKRDLLKDNDFGQVDIPKMIKANVGLQGFTIVSKSPKGQNFDENTGDSDNITLLYVMQRRPVSSWSSLTKRAEVQCEDLFRFEKRSEGKFRVILSKDDFAKYLEDRKKNKEITAGFLGVEGAHALDAKLENLEVLYNAGVRMMSPTHFFDNKLGGSAHGVSHAGLTDFGKEVISKMVEKHMIIDIAHSSPQIIDDIISMTDVPIITSHTGVKGTCDNVRNLSDRHLKAIAESGGLVGIAMFEKAVCGTDAAATAKAIKYAIALIGADHVVLGSDFDGSVTTPFDITGLPLIVEELLKLDISEDDIRKVMGENVKRFMLKNLPG